MAAIEDKKFREQNEFSTKECVICLDEFINGSEIKTIPICHHFFHPECCTKWFKSKRFDSEQKCP